ncbi:hypothetical protein [Novosphingobium resinovorum]|uniref:hypothetical protein n=1 Tax=Novosphingobium resinovorum TaxID=158500 RepID=UPI003B8A7D0C
MLFAGIVYEDAAEKHGLGAEQATLFGAGYPGLADIVTAVLWSTMADRFPSIARLLPEHAPRVDALTQRMQAVPSLARLASDSREVYGDAYCGGQIERSLREVAC